MYLKLGDQQHDTVVYTYIRHIKPDRDFPGGPVTKTPRSQRMGPGSIPGQGNRPGTAK